MRKGAGEGKIKALSRDARQEIVCTSIFREIVGRARRQVISRLKAAPQQIHALPGVSGLRPSAPLGMFDLNLKSCRSCGRSRDQLSISRSIWVEPALNLCERARRG